MSRLQRSLIVVFLVGVLVVLLLGLYGVFGPVQVTDAAGRTDRACMVALKRRGVPYEERERRCRIRIRQIATVGTSQTGTGYWKWRVGNEIWRFYVEASWSMHLVGPPPVWRIDAVRCWKAYVYIVGLDITECGKWRSSGVDYGGASYVTSFGPVSVGGRTYITLRSSGLAEGVFSD